MRMKHARSQSFVDVRNFVLRRGPAAYNFRVIWRRWLPQSTIMMIVWMTERTDGIRGRVLQRLHSVTYVPIHRHHWGREAGTKIGGYDKNYTLET